jgi:hypothetical protein
MSNQFAGPDSLSLYNKNCKIFGPNWYYYSNPITYRWNSKKFRMNKEIEKVDWNNYIYFSGCSYTVGAGVELERSFPYLAAQQLSIDYVNTAISGASVELVLQNTVEFLKECNKYPKAAIINWPEIFRTSWWENNGEVGLYMPKEYSGNWVSSYKQFLKNNTHIRKRFQFIRNTVVLIFKLANVPILEVSTALGFSSSSDEIFNGIISLPSFHDHTVKDNPKKFSTMHYNWARDFGFHDGGHPGWLHHENAANLIVEWITSRSKQ